MRTRLIAIFALTVVGALAVVGWRQFPAPPTPAVARAPRVAPVPAAAPPVESAALSREPEVTLAPLTLAPPGPEMPPLPAPEPVRVPATPPGIAATPPGIATAPPPAAGTVRAKKPKPPLQDPVARLAMSAVGADPEAEAYWVEAIFDPSLPAKEREDLMEDLNEEGLSDHKHPGPEDFELIVNRLALIEEIAPDADEFMLRHLQEAYQDLVNLAAVSQGGGNPVR